MFQTRICFEDYLARNIRELCQGITGNISSCYCWLSMYSLRDSLKISFRNSSRSSEINPEVPTRVSPQILPINIVARFYSRIILRVHPEASLAIASEVALEISPTSLLEFHLRIAPEIPAGIYEKC